MEKQINPFKILLLLAAITLSCMNARCQYVAAGAGYCTAKSGFAVIQAGAALTRDEKQTKAIDLVYLNLGVNLRYSNSAELPQFFGARYGHTFGNWQPNAGIDYHKYSNDLYNWEKPDQGFQLAVGLTRYFKQLPIRIDVCRTGKFYYGAVIIYGLLD